MPLRTPTSLVRTSSKVRPADASSSLCPINTVGTGIPTRSLRFSEEQIRVNAKFWRVTHYRDAKIDESKFRHEVIKVTLSDRSKYIVDLAGAQYGQLQVIMPCEEYHSKYVTELCKEHAHGHQAEWFRARVAGSLDHEMPPTTDMRVPLIQDEIAKCLDAAVKEWETENKSTVAQLLREKTPVFRAKKADLLAKISGDMRD